MQEFKYTLLLSDRTERSGVVEANNYEEARQLVDKMYPAQIDNSVRITLKKNTGKVAKDMATTVAGVGIIGTLYTAGCLLQCVFAAIPVLIGIYILRWLFG